MGTERMSKFMGQSAYNKYINTGHSDREYKLRFTFPNGHSGIYLNVMHVVEPFHVLLLIPPLANFRISKLDG